MLDLTLITYMLDLTLILINMQENLIRSIVGLDLSLKQHVKDKQA